MVSLADRYARILNPLSPLISSRSAISASIWAMARLSTQQPALLEGVLEDRGSACGERLGNVRATLRRAIAEQAPATAGPAYLCRRCAGLGRPCDQPLD